MAMHPSVHRSYLDPDARSTWRSNSPGCFSLIHSRKSLPQPLGQLADKLNSLSIARIMALTDAVTHNFGSMSSRLERKIKFNCFVSFFSMFPNHTLRRCCMQSNLQQPPIFSTRMRRSFWTALHVSVVTLAPSLSLLVLISSSGGIKWAFPGQSSLTISRRFFKRSFREFSCY